MSERRTRQIIADLLSCVDDSDSSHDTSMWLLREAAHRLEELETDTRDADVLEMENRNLRAVLRGLGVSGEAIDRCAERVPR